MTTTPQVIDLLIDARWIAPVDADGLLTNHAVALDKGRIVAVLPSGEAHARYAPGEKVSLPDHILIPGLINLHTHAAMSLMRGLADDLPLETFNGNIESSTGRYEASVWKPFHAFTGTTLSTLSTLSAAFGSRGTEETNVICVAPNTECMDFEIAADYVYNHAPIAQDTPNLCVYGNSAGKYLTNIVPPKDGNIGEFGDSNMRDILVKAGFCTVKLTDGKYEMIDLVTTRNVPEYPQESMPYRWVRDNNIIWNMKYALKIYEDLYVKGKTIVGDTDTVSASNTISPNRYISILDTKYFPDLIDRALIISYSGLLVGKGTTNPNRFETYFESTLTGVARVISTTMSISNNF